MTTIKLDTRVQNLQFAKAWEHLTEREKNYAYWMSKASWAGSLMVYHQLCYEAPALFCVFMAYFSDPDFKKLEQCAAGAGISAEEW